MSVILVSRAEIGRLRWDAFVEAHPHGWWWQRSEWLDYCLAYEAARDWSFMLFTSQGVPVALCPAIVNPTRSLRGGNAPLGEPLLSTLGLSGCSIGCVVEAQLLERARLAGVQTAEFRTDPVLPLQGHGSTLLSPTNGWTSTRYHSQVLNLSEEGTVLQKGLRKSYRGEVKKQLATYIVAPVTQGYHEAVEQMRLCHVTQAGRETRPVQTWEMVTRWLVSNRAEAVVAMDRATHQCVGFAYALHYKSRAYYACGASLEAGHAIQWTLIQRLKRIGCRYYELGWQDVETEDEKARNIAFFKRGFGGTAQPFYLMTQTFT